MRSVQYLRFLIQSTDLAQNMGKALEILIENKSVGYKNIEICSDEYNLLWKLKNETVKLNACLNLCFQHWDEILRGKISEDESEEYVGGILKDLIFVNGIVGNTIVHTYKECKEKNPWIFGLMWRMCRDRTNWQGFTRTFERKMNNEEIHSTVIDFLFPGNGSYTAGFYTELIDILKELRNKAKDIEDGVDWVFEHVNNKPRREKL